MTPRAAAVALLRAVPRACPLIAAAAYCVAVSFAAPVPSPVQAPALVADLSASDSKVRDQAVAALRGRSDATPWLRRAVRSGEADTARRAAALLAGPDGKRQDVVARALDTAIREGSADLFLEWHQFWQPKAKDDLWPVGPRMGKAALDAYAERLPGAKTNHLEEGISLMYFPGQTYRYHDGPQPERFGSDLWHIRTNKLRTGESDLIGFASVGGSAEVGWLRNGYYFALGPVTTREVQHAVVVCADGLCGILSQSEYPGRLRMSVSLVVHRGNAALADSNIFRSVLLVDGDIDLTGATQLKESFIRASGAIHLPKNFKPVNCTIEAHAKNATAPYKFFELADVGLSLADDEEGLVVTGVKADTPFGNCGIAKGDLIRAIDDVPAGHSEEFRKKVRRALVRQGDCLVTVVRGDKTLDLPVFFPLPK